MTSDRTILFATDFSAHCDRALTRALMLARSWQARLVIAHVIETEAHGQSDGDRQREELRVLKRLQSEVDDPSIHLEHRLARGKAAKMLVKLAHDECAELIVTGVSHFDGFSEALLGTTVNRLVRISDLPVLIVKQRPRLEYQELLVTTDFSDASAQALLTALHLFPAAHCNLMHAYHVPYEGYIKGEAALQDVKREVEGEFQAFLQSLSLADDQLDRIKGYLEYGETCTAARLLLEQTNASLTVVSTHGRSGFIKAMIGSIAEALLACMDSDILMVRGK